MFVEKSGLESKPKQIDFVTRIDPPKYIELVSIERYTGTVSWTDPEAVDDVLKFRYSSNDPLCHTGMNRTQKKIS